jgi:uncharacterized FlaG/YvyC family protein
MQVPPERIRQIRNSIPYDLRQRLTKHVLHEKPDREKLQKIISDIEKQTKLVAGQIQIVIDDLLLSKEKH